MKRKITTLLAFVLILSTFSFSVLAAKDNKEAQVPNTKTEDTAASSKEKDV